MSSMQTSVPPPYIVSPSAPTVVQVSKNNNAIKQPLEPKYCCFKARNYILFILIFRILLDIGATISVVVSDKYSDKINHKILSVIPISITALGITGVRKRSCAIFTIFLALKMIYFTHWFITECKKATKVQYEEFMGQDIPYAAFPIMYSLGEIFYFFIPVIKYACFLRTKEAIRTFQQYNNA